MAYHTQTRSYWKWGNLTLRDETYGPAEGQSIWQYCPLPLLFDPSIGFQFFDDFYVFDATNNPHWVVDEDAGKGGTDGVQDTQYGWYKHFCNGDDNDASTVALVKENFGLTEGKGLWFEVRVKLTEAQTNKANYAFGIAETVDKTFMQNDGAGPLATSDHIVWFKEDANMKLSFETSLGATQTTKADLLTHVSGHVYRLGFYAKPASATTFTVYPFYVDETAGGTPTLDTTNACTLTLTGWGPGQPFFSVKNGDTGAEEYIEIDYIKVIQAR